MRTARLDSKRRLVMPLELEPRAAVTIQSVDADTWLVKRLRPARGFKMVMVPVIGALPDHPGWEKTELKLARAASKKLPEPG